MAEDFTRLRLMNFVYEEQLDEAKKTRGERIKDGTAYRDKPLFQILKENKDKKDAGFNERFKYRQSKALDDDETEFLDQWETSKKECERQVADEEAQQLLSFQMQQVPSLHRLMFTEGKINAFIQCFVAVRRISSLYDLEVAVCKNEGIEKFDELGLGPLVRHPLVLHYYSVKSDTNEVYKITSDEIISLLYFIVKKRSIASKEDHGIRIQSKGWWNTNSEQD